jgi:hypothetical protein
VVFFDEQLDKPGSQEIGVVLGEVINSKSSRLTFEIYLNGFPSSEGRKEGAPASFHDNRPMPTVKKDRCDSLTVSVK